MESACQSQGKVFFVCLFACFCAYLGISVNTPIFLLTRFLYLCLPCYLPGEVTFSHLVVYRDDLSEEAPGNKSSMLSKVKTSFCPW